jgi:hypothetical protein
MQEKAIFMCIYNTAQRPSQEGAVWSLAGWLGQSSAPWGPLGKPLTR